MNVAVVIPTANRRPDRLLRAIRSVLDQKRAEGERIELVVANNSRRALPDEVAALAREGALRVVEASRVRGASHARNRGAAATRSKRLAFLDDDDWWEPTFLEALEAALDRSAADMAICGFWNWNPGSVRTPGKLLRETPDLDTLYQKNPGFRGSNFMIRRERFEALRGFEESLPTSNDKDFLIRFLRGGGRLATVPERLVNLDRGEHARLTQAHWTKVAGTRRFLELHARFMKPSRRRKVLFQLRLQQALTERSYASLLGLAVQRPSKARKVAGLAWALWRGRPLKV